MSHDSQRWRELAAASAAGGAAGAALVAADILCGQIVATPLTPSLWAVLAAYYVPAGAVAAGAAELLFRPRVPWPRAAGRALAWILAVVAAVYAVAVVNQNVLRGPGWGLAPRALFSGAAAAAVVAAAAVQERSLRGARLGPFAAGGRRVLLFIAFLALLHVGLPLAARVPAAAAALLLPLAALAATAALAAPITAASARTPTAAPALCLVVLAAIVLSGNEASRRAVAGCLRDQPQPDAAAAATLAGKPNVALVVLDTVRAANLSCYGHPRRTTPHLDALAAEGVRYTRATTTAGWSLPAHASLFTGLFPRQHRVGLWANGAAAAPVLDPRHVTLAEALAARGYATAGISANPLVGPAFGLDQGFRYFHSGGADSIQARAHPLLRRVQGWLPEPFVAEPLRQRFARFFPPAAEVTEEALAWLDRPRTQPFFLFVNYMDVHPPRLPRGGYSDRWPGGAGPVARLPAWADVDDSGKTLMPDQVDALARLYDGALAYVDEQLGPLLRRLQALPDGGRTWIIVTADHGEALGEHGRLGHHCSVHEEVLRVPLIMRYPRAMGPKPGTVDDGPVQLADIAPLVLSAVGAADVQPPGARPAGAMLATAECACGDTHPLLHGDVQDALTVDELKYVEESGRAPRLFDLRRDPGESADLRAQLPQDAARLQAQLDRWRGSLVPLPSAPADAAAAREREEALRALGYLR